MPKEGPSLLWLGTITLRYRRLILVVTAAMAAMAVVVTLLIREFTSTAMFVPDAPRVQQSSLGALAERFGMGGLVGGAQDPPEFYVALLTADDFLARLATGQYEFVQGVGGTEDTVRVRPLDLYGGGTGESGARVQAAVEALRDRIEAQVDPRSNVITVRVTARWGWLAERLNRRALELLNEFNLRQRRSRAAAERQFTEARLAAAQQELAEAEDYLEAFHRRNRSYGDSPVLLLEVARLQRRVELRQQVYVTLAQAYEQARIEEVRNTPVITVIDEPEGSAQRSHSLVLNAVLGLIAGLGAGVLVALFAEFATQHRRQHSDDYAEFERAARDALPTALTRRFGAAIRKGSGG